MFEISWINIRIYDIFCLRVKYWSLIVTALEFERSKREVRFALVFKSFVFLLHRQGTLFGQFLF